MDEWHDNTASVCNQILASATKSTLEDVIPSTHPSHVTTATTPTPTTTSTQDNKKKTQENIELLLEHVVGNSGLFVSFETECTRWVNPCMHICPLPILFTSFQLEFQRSCDWDNTLCFKTIADIRSFFVCSERFLPDLNDTLWCARVVIHNFEVDFTSKTLKSRICLFIFTL